MLFRPLKHITFEAVPQIGGVAASVNSERPGEAQLRRTSNGIAATTLIVLLKLTRNELAATLRL